MHTKKIKSVAMASVLLLSAVLVTASPASAAKCSVTYKEVKLECEGTRCSASAQVNPPGAGCTAEDGNQSARVSFVPVVAVTP